jgi:hypothetical protein
MIPNKLIEGEMVKVRWVDSAQPTSEWTLYGDLPQPAIIYCNTLGYVLNVQDDLLRLCMSTASHEPASKPMEQVSGIMVIPSAAIIDIFRVKYDQ